ncbi:MAG: hypothetical protein IT370_22855 [Deltaproteobacteria bacterium]|nr:hypothetical protein [Deltaproteobacteria bacterium]
MTTITKLACAALLLSLAAPAAAQTPEDKATAEALFKEGRRLMDAKDYPQACPKLEASQRLDPAVGTLFNLAACYELSLRTASAFATWRQVENLAGLAKQTSRQKYARDKANALESLVPKVVLEVTPTPGLIIKRNGVVVDPALWGLPLSVDPGAISIEASAPGYVTFTAALQAAESTQSKVAIPALVAEPVASPEPTSPPTPTPSPTPSPRPTPSPSMAPPAAVPPLPLTSGPVRHPRRKWAYVVGGVGLVTLGAGVVFGLMARSDWSTAEAHCDDDIVCDRTGYDAATDAQSAATLSTVLVSVGAAATVGGLVLWLTAPGVREMPAAAATSSLRPAAIGDLGLVWRGAF